MDNDVIDSAILLVCDVHWLKVARIVVFATEAAGLDSTDQSYDVVADRIIGLVKAGHLEGAGNLHDWRHSEVRLPAQLAN